MTAQHEHNCSNIDYTEYSEWFDPSHEDDVNGYARSNIVRFLQNFNVSGNITLNPPARYNFDYTYDGLPDPRYFRRTYFTEYAASGTLTVTPKKQRYTFGDGEIYAGTTATPSPPHRVQGNGGEWSEQYIHGDRNSNVKIRFYEPATGRWCECIEHYDWGTFGEGDGTWVRLEFRCSDSGENYTSSNLAGVYPTEDFSMKVFTDGVVQGRGYFSRTTSYPIFTPGNEIQITFYIITDNGAWAFRHLETRGDYFEPGVFNEIFTGSKTPRWLFDPTESMPTLTMSGRVTGPCTGWSRYAVTEPVTPWPSAAEQIWSSKGCAYPGLRHALSGQYGRHGFLIDPLNENSFFMMTLTMQTDYAPQCSPDTDQFIQSINAWYPGSNYSMYALKPSSDSVFGEGSLVTNDILFNYVTDRGEYDLNDKTDFDFTGNRVKCMGECEAQCGVYSC